MILDPRKKADDRNTKKFRDAILFEEILSSNQDLLLYDCQGFVFKREFLLLLAITLFFSSTLCLVIYYDVYKSQIKTLTNEFSTTMIIVLMAKRYRFFQKNYVDKIIYHSMEKKLSLHKKGFFGKDYFIKVHKNNLLHTTDNQLNAKGINYINIENLEVYKIGYNYAWVEKEFFAHLIGQNIIS